jgi:two-component system chemotaxis sensor kinase CheA
MSSMSDMVLARNELARRLRDGDIDPKGEAAFDRLSLTVADMSDTVTRPRMQKVEAHSRYYHGWYAIPARSCARR